MQTLNHRVYMKTRKTQNFMQRRNLSSLTTALSKRQYLMTWEILVNKTTSISQSPYKFEIASTKEPTDTEIWINEVFDSDDGSKVSLKVTVVSIAPGRVVSTEKVQDVVLCDATGFIDLSVWEEKIDKSEYGNTSWSVHSILSLR